MKIAFSIVLVSLAVNLVAFVQLSQMQGSSGARVEAQILEREREVVHQISPRVNEMRVRVGLNPAQMDTYDALVGRAMEAAVERVKDIGEKEP